MGHGRERRRHVRVDGSWPVTAHGVEHTGRVRAFSATMLNVSLGGVGAATATVRRFLEYGEGGTRTSRWGVELTGLTVHQRALWGRFVYTAAPQYGHALTSKVVEITSPETQVSVRGARAAAHARRV
jgi:hypothetical protein